MPRTSPAFLLGTLALIAPAARAEDKAVPRIVLVGDSTMNVGTQGQQGWGVPFAALADPSLVAVENRARGGRSSRTFLTEGLWDKVVESLKPGDFVLIQFGHNDGGPVPGGKNRASLKGTGEETKEITGPTTGKPEVVHTYGWYLRKYAADVRAKGATPVVVSPVPRNIWKDDDKTVARASRDYGLWASEAAKQSGALFLDLNELVAARYEKTGRDTVASKYFGTDHTHTTPAGARVTADVVARGLRDLPDSPFARLLPPPAPVGDIPPVNFRR